MQDCSALAANGCPCSPAGHSWDVRCGRARRWRPWPAGLRRSRVGSEVLCEGGEMARTPEEVFQHHAEALGAGDLDQIVADYADDAVFITPGGVRRGKDGIREAFTQLLADVPNAAWDLKTLIFENDVLFLEWGARAGPP